MTDSRLDQHLVAHDCCALAVAAGFGIIAAMTAGSIPVGLGTALVLSMLGIGLMRVRSFRYAVNRLSATAKGNAR